MPVAKGVSLDPERTRSAMRQAASRLFYERGLDGIGVAELCAAVGVSKETLYRHFGSKDGLIRAVLELRSERVNHWLGDVIRGAGDDPAAQIGAVFDAMGRWYQTPGFRGCAIMNAAAQHHEDPVAALTAAHLTARHGLLVDIAHRAAARDPALLAEQWMMLIAGATTVANHFDRSGAAAAARAAALALLAGEVDYSRTKSPQ
jgi:AcrR family transcriptional regulator